LLHFNEFFEILGQKQIHLGFEKISHGLDVLWVCDVIAEADNSDMPATAEGSSLVFGISENSRRSPARM
jgi:hypothetical protein